MTNSEGLTGRLQENILVLVLFSELSTVVRASVDVSLFTSRPYRDIVSRAYAFLDQYGKPPGEHIADELEDLLKQEGEHGQLIAAALYEAHQQWSSGAFNEHYVATQLEHFVHLQALKVGIIKAYEHMQRNELEAADAELKKAMQAKAASFTPGITLKEGVALLANPETRRRCINLHIPEIDRLQLGPARQELHLLVAPPKGGKSQWLTHCAKRAIMQRWKGVYLTLELADQLVVRRMLMSLFARKSRDDAEIVISKLQKSEDGGLESITNLAQPRIKSIQSSKAMLGMSKLVDDNYLEGRLLVKNFATGTLTVNGISAYLDQLESIHKFVPDFVALDYADLMKLDTNNYRLDLGALYKDLRGLAVERNLALITASQSNRGGAKARLILGSDVAEDFSKIGTADCVLTLTATPQERRRGLARLFVAAGRVEADNFSVVLTQSYASGQFVLQSWLMRQEYWTFLTPEEQPQSEN